MNSFIEILIFLPLVGALIGYVSKWMAIRMLFHPSRWIGIGPLGWQGVVQRRSPKFAAGVADTVARSGIAIDELVARLDPQEVADLVAPVLARELPALAQEVVEQVKPGAWATVPPPVRDGLAAQLDREGRRITTAVITALTPALPAAVDLRAMVIAQLSGPNADRLARLFQRVGRRELQVVIYYGAVLGFLIGLLEVGGYAALEKWWLLPIIGALDGLVNNWFAIQMIFRPLERTRYLGVFPFQGLFPARQREIAREYADMLAKEVLRPRDLLAHVDAAGAARLRALALDTAEREAAPLFDMLGMMLATPVAPAQRRAALEALITRVLATGPALLDDIEGTLIARLGVAATLEQQLAAMPKLEFEAVLRGIFEEDEWILVALGGFLGGSIGMVQAAIVLALQ